MKCPNCNIKLKIDEIIGENENSRWVGGHCPQCNKSFSWTQEFKRILILECDLEED